MYIGLDVHKSSIYATVTDKQGKVLISEEFRNTCNDIKQFVESLGNGDKYAVIEATCAWMHVYEQLERLNVSTVLAHPLKVKAIASARIKTDKIDSTILAHLLRTDMIPESYVPEKRVRELRDITRQRTVLVKQKTQLKNRIHAILTKNQISSSLSDVFGKSGMMFLRELDLPDNYRSELDRYLNIIEAINAEIYGIDKQIRLLAKSDESAKLLMTIPGISYYSALLIVAEIGDIKRFSNHEKLCSWAGIVPSVHSSGSMVIHGRITKPGSKWLRWILTQCAHVAIRMDCPFREQYLRISKRRGKKIAVTAVSRKMLKVIWFMLTRGEAYKY